MTQRRLVVFFIAAAIAGCAKKEPEAKPSPVGEAVAAAVAQRDQIEAQTGGEVGSLTVRFVEPPEDVFVDLFVAAAFWAKSSTSARSMGVLQAEGAEPRWRRAVEAVNQRYALRPINPSDFTVVCGNPQTQSTSRGGQRCSMKYVDAVLAFNSIRIRRDSGYVGLNVSRVPSGADRAERIYYCVTLGRVGGEWKARKSDRVVDPQRCLRNWG